MASGGALTGPDLSEGVRDAELADGVPLVGHAGGEAVMLVRSGAETFAVGASCTHYGGPLGEGLVVAGTVRCPWHHACFELRSGAASGPALSAIPCFEVVRDGDLVRVGKKRPPTPRATPRLSPSSVVIVGAGVAGAACALALRDLGYEGSITLLGDEEPGPVDRPNLSKDYLAGSAPEEWVTLRGRDVYEGARIELVLSDPVATIEPGDRRVTLASGRAVPYGALLLATGAAPNRLAVKGADGAHVHVLRTLADSRAVIARATSAKRAVVLGASFIGLEVAASLRQRGLDVVVVGPEAVPLARVLGDAMGAFVRALHEEHGVAFRLGRTPVEIRDDSVVLDDGEVVPAELVVMGVGVRPRTELAERAGLRVDRGIVTDERLRTSAPDVWAAGDVARFPWRGSLVRIEHFAVAARQGQAVARSMLGDETEVRDVPFFWSQHYDVSISYVGHAASWDDVQIRGDLAKRDALVAFRKGGEVLAVATVFRDGASLAVERALETGDAAALEAVLRDAG